VQYLIEETLELIDAIETGDKNELIEELGDVLDQVIFHSDIAAEAGQFTLEDVAAHMTAKMIGRHPHVFGDVVADTSDAVIANWEVLKKVEKPERTSVLDGIPDRMPSLLLAPKLVGRAERVGLAPATTEIPATESELGDELLAMVVAARAAGFDPERALRNALRTLKQDITAAEGAA
jgi:XTP/dITP diphosphohydrolase